MKFKIVACKGGYKVQDVTTGKFYSRAPLEKQVAERQLSVMTNPRSGRSKHPSRD